MTQSCEMMQRKAFSLLHGKRYGEALSLLRRAVSAAPPPGQERIVHDACVAAVTWDTSELESGCKQAYRQVDQDVLLRIKGSILFDLGDADSGLALMRRAVQLNPSIKNMLVLVSRLDNTACLEEAAVLYERILWLCPRHVPALVGRACLEAQLGDRARAKKLLYEALELCPIDAEAHYNLGVALAEDGLFRKALRELRKSIRLRHPRSEWVWSAMAEVFLKIGQLSKAAWAAKKALTVAPNCPEAQAIPRTIQPVAHGMNGTDGSYVTDAPMEKMAIHLTQPAPISGA
jgi:tetratricopeptide (TPR) repeat protein